MKRHRLHNKNGVFRGFFRGLPAILLILSSGSAFAATVEKIVATVNGAPITLSELDEAASKYGSFVQKDGGAATLRARALDKLIDEKLLDQAMKKSGLKVEPHEIDAYIDRIIRSSRINREVFEQKLGEKGLTVERYRAQLEEQMLKNKFVNQEVGRKIGISERELKEYFQNHMDEFKSASVAKLAQITIPFTANMTQADIKKIEELAIQIAEEARGSVSFELLAKKYGGKPYAVESGDLGIVHLKDLQPTIAENVKMLGAGQSSGPIPTGGGITIIRVVDRAKSSEKDFTNIRDSVYDVLYNAKIKEALQSYVRQLRKSGNIEIKGLGAE